MTNFYINNTIYNNTNVMLNLYYINIIILQYL